MLFTLKNLIDRCANNFANLALIWMKVATEVGVNGQRDWVSCASRWKTINLDWWVRSLRAPSPLVLLLFWPQKKKILEIVFPPISPGCFWRPPSATDPRGVRLRNRSKNVSLKAEDTREEAEPNRRKWCFFLLLFLGSYFINILGEGGGGFGRLGRKSWKKMMMRRKWGMSLLAKSRETQSRWAEGNQKRPVCPDVAFYRVLGGGCTLKAKWGAYLQLDGTL